MPWTGRETALRIGTSEPPAFIASYHDNSYHLTITSSGKKHVISGSMSGETLRNVIRKKMELHSADEQEAVADELLQCGEEALRWKAEENKADD